MATVKVGFQTSPATQFFKIILIAFLLSDMKASAHIYKRCELAQELLSLNFQRSHLPDWVCLVENESGRRNNVTGGPNKNGSYDYGIFQINSNYWCGDGKVCGIPCSALVDDDIRDDARCALRIYDRHGFSAWNGWNKNCKNATKPNLGNCFAIAGDD